MESTTKATKGLRRPRASPAGESVLRGSELSGGSMIDSNALGISLTDPTVLLESVIARFIRVDSVDSYIVVSTSPVCGRCLPTFHGKFCDERSAKRALLREARIVAPTYWLSCCMKAWAGDDLGLISEWDGEPFYNEDGTPIGEPEPDFHPHVHPLSSFDDRIGIGVTYFCDVCHVTCTSSSDFTCTLCDDYNECRACPALSPAERAQAYSRRFFDDYRVFMDGGEGTI